MTASVSTLARSSGATRPSREMNLSMLCLAERAHIDKMAGYRRRRRHRRTDEMRAAAGTLTAFEIAIGSRCATFARRQLIFVHAQAHRAPGLAPFEAGFDEDLVEAFLFRLPLHEARTRHHHCKLHIAGDFAPAGDRRSRA